jgi:hypothetical protein
MNTRLPLYLFITAFVCACGKGDRLVDTPHKISGLQGFENTQSVQVRKGVNLAWGTHPSDGTVEVIMVIDGSQVLRVNVFGNGHQALLDAASAGTLMANVNRGVDGSATLDVVRMRLNDEGKREIKTYDQNGDVLSVKVK